MPTYLVHGFRWSRPDIRVFVILENIDDASPDWIVRPATTRSLLDTLYTKFDFLPPRPPVSETASQQTAPDKAPPSLLTVQAGHPVKFVEEFDPDDLDAVAPPHAYVADHVVAVDLSVSVTDELAAYEERQAAARSGKTLPAMGEPVAAGKSDKKAGKATKTTLAGAGWLERLRDQLQEGSAIGWYVVVNGDEQRGWQMEEDDDEEVTEDEEEQEMGQAEEFEAKWPIADPTQKLRVSTAEDEHARALRQLRYEIGGFGDNDDDDEEVRRDVDGEEEASLSTAATTTTTTAMTSPPEEQHEQHEHEHEHEQHERHDRHDRHEQHEQHEQHENHRPSSSSTGLGRLLKSRQRSRSRSDARHRPSPPPSSGQSSPKPPPVPPIPASSSTPPTLRHKASSSFRRLFSRSRPEDSS